MRVMLENTRTGPRIASLGGCGCFEIVMQIFFLDGNCNIWSDNVHKGKQIGSDNHR